MEYSESSKGMLEKMITNDTLAKMTRGSSHFNPKSGVSNGFRSPMIPSSHLNGKTLSSLSQSGSKSNPDQPRRSVITLKNAPGPPVNSSGTGVLKTKSGCLDRFSTESKAVRGRSRKRSREGDPPDVSNHEERKDGCEQSTSASETLEPTKRKRRGQNSKRVDKRNGHISMADFSSPKSRVSNSSSVSGILDIYGLKSKAVDISRFMIDVPLDKLLSDNFEKSWPPAMENDSGNECRLVIEEISNVMQLLPKPTSVQKLSVENALNEDVKVRLMLDLERPLQPEEGQQIEDRHESSGSSLDKARSKSLELFPTFSLEDLPLYTVDEFRERLKLPVNDSLETLISYSKPTDPALSASEKSSRFEGIPPSPFSFSPCGVRIDAPRNGRTAERQWPKDSVSKLKAEQTLVTSEASELVKSIELRLPIRPKGELTDDLKPETFQKEEVRDLERSKPEASKKGFPVHSDLPSLQLKGDEGETSHCRRSLNMPAMPCSPGVQAATILCNMANSEEKEVVFNHKGKRSSDEPTTQRTSKLARVVEERDGCVNAVKRETSGQATAAAAAAAAGSVKKSPVNEKRKSLSQVNHSLSSVSKRLADSGPGNAARNSSSSGQGLKAPDDQQHHQSGVRELGRSSKMGMNSSSVKVKESRDQGKMNGGVSSGGGKAGKSPVSASKREALTVSSSSRASRCFVSSGDQQPPGKTKTKLR